MSLGAQSDLVMLISFVLYLTLPVALLIRGWLIRAGLAMVFAALLPVLWQGFFTDSDAPGFALLLILTAPLPIIIIAIGLIARLYRVGKRAFAQLQRRTGAGL